MPNYVAVNLDVSFLPFQVHLSPNLSIAFFSHFGWFLFPVMQAIFAGEKIQDITSLAANAILILGQGSLYAYTIS